MDKPTKFYAFRYFVIPYKQQSLFTEKDKNKKEVIQNIFLELEKSNRKSHKIKDKQTRDHTLYFTHKFNSQLYLCKFARESHITKHEEINKDIKSIKDKDLPYIYLIIDLKHQIVLFEKYTPLFRRVTTAANKFRKWVKQEIITNYDYTFKVEEITFESTFWDYINNSEKIYRLFLHLNSPNLFEGKVKVEKLLNKVQGFFNNTDTCMSVENEKGNLIIDKKTIEGAIKYIAGGGGDWKLKSDYKGTTQEFKSKDKNNIKSIELPDRNILEDKIDDNLKRKIENKINEIEDILKENK